MKPAILFSALAFLFSVTAQSQDNSFYENGKNLMRQGDYANAAVALAKALQQEPSSIEIAKDLALDYYLEKKYSKALDIINPVVDNSNADEQSFQLAGNIYKALGDAKEGEKIYKKGIKKFSGSGALYNDYGEFLWSNHDNTAIKLWEKGIETDPNFSGNYYNASKYYYTTPDKVWSIIYSEIFINIEPLTGKTAEMKGLLFDSYKKFFADMEPQKSTKEKSTFEQAFLQTMNKEKLLAADGINAGTLTMIRTRFILNWFETFGSKYPFKLFEYHRQLLRDGMFDAYNQSIFEASQDLAAYQNWSNVNSEEYNDFSKLQKSRVFKVAVKQYYHK